jgi:hypothetical protein
MPIPSPRDTILRSRFDTSTRRTLIAVLDSVWKQCGDHSDANGYRLAGSILDSANAGQRWEEAIKHHALKVMRSAQ